MPKKMIFKGTPAPDFKVVSQEMKDVGLLNFKGKIKVITFFLSCDCAVRL